MELDLRYYKTKGIYMLNGVRVVLLPRGSLELIQDYVANILGLATKSIFDDAMSATVYSFLTELIKSKQIKLRGEERTEDEIFTLFKDMGFGTINAISKEIDSYSVTVDRGFNSILAVSKSFNYCFQMGGLLSAAYRIILDKDVKVNELKCKTAGNTDVDWFEVKILETTTPYNYVELPAYDLSDQNFEKIETPISDVGPLVNSMPAEVVPVVLFPYLFTKLRKIVGMGAYGIQYGMGTTMSKLYFPYPMNSISTKYQVNGFDLLSPLSGVGMVKAIKNEFGGLSEIDVFDSFNALYITPEREKRCFLLSGIFTGLSYLLVGNNLKMKETECSAINNTVCKFSFE